MHLKCLGPAAAKDLAAGVILRLFNRAVYNMYTMIAIN